MKHQKTIYHLVVDKSGSMQDVVEQTTSGFNEQIQMIKGLKSEFPNQAITLGLTLFNDEIVHHYIDKLAIEVERLNSSNYRPEGTTALLDAIGLTVQKLENAQHESNVELPTKIVMVILTDGYENSSKHFNLEDIQNTINRLESTGNWTFNYIGATLDALNIAKKMAFKKGNSLAFDKKEMKSEVWDKLTDSVTCYMKRIDAKENSDQFFSDSK